MLFIVSLLSFISNYFGTSLVKYCLAYGLFKCGCLISEQVGIFSLYILLIYILIPLLSETHNLNFWRKEMKKFQILLLILIHTINHKPFFKEKSCFTSTNLWGHWGRADTHRTLRSVVKGSGFHTWYTHPKKEIRFRLQPRTSSATFHKRQMCHWYFLFYRTL